MVTPWRVDMGKASGGAVWEPLLNPEAFVAHANALLTPATLFVVPDRDCRPTGPGMTFCPCGRTIWGGVVAGIGGCQ